MGRGIVKTSPNQEEVLDKETLAALRIVETGSCLRRVKHRSLGGPHTVTLSSDHSLVDYQSRHSWSCIPDRLKSIAVSELLEVREGWNTDNFHKASSRKEFTDQAKERCCFSVVFRHPLLFHKSLDLVAESEEEARAWTLALRHLIAAAKRQTLHFHEEEWLRAHFAKADVDASATLTFPELWALLRSLNLELSEDYGRRIFNSPDIRRQASRDGAKDSAIDCEEFIKFFRSLTQRKDLETVMKDWSKSNTDCLFPEDLQRFLVESQGFTDVTVEKAEELIREFEPEEKNKKEVLMGSNGFRRLLLSHWGSLRHKDHHSVLHDMSLPLTDYFINSSHNTYLVSGQLRGEASVEGYIHALKKGARLVELDVWDGPDGEPRLTHGHTFVEPIFLVDACRAIAKYAFFCSQFPLFLSIENHCGVEQQQRMAAIFREEFGSKLLRRRFTPDDAVMPSPAELSNKILVKAKRLPGFVIAETIVDGHGSLTDGEVTDDDSEPDDADAPDLARSQSVKKTVKIAQEFSDVTSITGAKLHDLREDLKIHGVDSFVSVGEKRMLGYLETDLAGVVAYTAKHFVKSYPKGLRTDSSNMDPVPQWQAGVQIVTMNMQTAGEEMDLNNGFFKQNGGCGYVLKPTCLRNGILDLAAIEGRTPTIYTLKIISGQYLPRPETAEDSEVIDPYVTVEVFGLPCDAQKVRTAVVRNNGFNPLWNECVRLPIRAPELALLRLTVKDYDKTSYNDFVGQYTLPIAAARKGFSHLPLSTGYDHSVDPSARLFVHLQIAA